MGKKRKTREPGDAVIYTRVSTDEQVDNTSLDSQEEACRRLCADLGLQVAGVFREEGVSATTLNRPELTKLRQHVRKNRRSITDVVVRYASRLSRDSDDVYALKAEWDAMGVRITVVGVPRDDSAHCKFRLNLDTALAQYDNDLKSEAVTEAMRRRTEQGRWCHQAPLGYRRGNPGQPSLIPDAQTAELVTMAFQLMADGGRTQVEVLEIVNDAGLRTRTGKPVSRQTFNQLLRRPLYMGLIEQDCYDPPVSVPGDFEPIVQAKTFERVQTRLDGYKNPSEPHMRDNPAFPLLGTTRCAQCGNPLRASFTTKKASGKRYGYYDCQTRGCRKGRARDEQLHNAFLQTLNTILPAPEQLKALDDALRRAVTRREQSTATTRRQLEAQVRATKTKVDRIEDMFFDGKIDECTYQERLPQAREEHRAADRRLAGHDDSHNLDIAGLLRFARHVLVNLPTVWKESSVTRRKAIQSSIFPNGIEISGGEVRTAETSMLFRHLRDFGDSLSNVVTPTGLEPVFSA